MKKVLLFIGSLGVICFVIFRFVSSVLTQTETEHLTFKGIPIDGPVSSFVRKMERKGLTCVEMQEGKAVFAGRFASQKDCVITAVASQEDNVSQVGVEFPERDVWTLLADDYFRLKRLLAREYGEPSECIERFLSGEIDDPDDDGKMLCVGQGRCRYETLFAVPTGLIKLWIGPSGDSKARLMLLYLDQENEPAVALNDAEDEL